MDVIELCPQCGTVMDERQGYAECPSCSKKIERKVAEARDERALTFKKKLAISLIVDVLDLTIFRIPVIGTIYDAFSVAVAMKLFGGFGFLSTWEIFDLTDQIDAEIPTLTAICLLQYFYERIASRKKP